MTANGRNSRGPKERSRDRTGVIHAAKEIVFYPEEEIAQHLGNNDEVSRISRQDKLPRKVHGSLQASISSYHPDDQHITC